MLLVHVSQRDGVGQELVEVIDALPARARVERDRHRDEMAEWLNFMSMLNGRERGSPHDLFGVKRFPGHGYSL
jgi:hypothetical protein